MGLELLLIVCLAGVGLAACGEDDPVDDNGQVADTGQQDSGEHDAGHDDTGDDDAGGEDAAGEDSGADAAEDDAGADAGEDLCDPNPCRNDGVCSEEADGYACACLDGFFGDHCEYSDALSPMCDDDKCVSAGRFFDPNADPDVLPERTISLREDGNEVAQTTLGTHGFYAFEDVPRATLEKIRRGAEEDSGGDRSAPCNGVWMDGHCFEPIEADLCHNLEVIEDDEEPLCLEFTSPDSGNGPDFGHTGFEIGASTTTTTTNPLELITEAKITHLSRDYVIAFTDDRATNTTDVTGEIVLEDGREMDVPGFIVVSQSFGEQREIMSVIVTNDAPEFTLEKLPEGTYDIEVRFDDDFDGWEAIRLSRLGTVELVNDPNTIKVGSIEITLGPGPYNPNGD